MSVNSRLETHLDYSSKESILYAETFESSCPRKETIDIDILVTSIGSSRFVSHRVRMSGEFDSKKDS